MSPQRKRKRRERRYMEVYGTEQSDVEGGEGGQTEVKQGVLDGPVLVL